MPKRATPLCFAPLPTSISRPALRACRTSVPWFRALTINPDDPRQSTAPCTKNVAAPLCRPCRPRADRLSGLDSSAKHKGETGASTRRSLRIPVFFPSLGTRAACMNFRGSCAPRRCPHLTASFRLSYSSSLICPFTLVQRCGAPLRAAAHDMNAHCALFPLLLFSLCHPHAPRAKRRHASVLCSNPDISPPPCTAGLPLHSNSIFLLACFIIAPLSVFLPYQIAASSWGTRVPPRRRPRR